MPGYDLTCVAHVHSTFSDGTATVPEIAAAARSAGAEAVLLTDHDTRAAARHGHEGWLDGVLVLVGHEITTRAGHLLAFGVAEEIGHHGLSEPEICAELRRRGGFGFAAHPFSRGGFLTSIVRPHPWRSLGECDGVGIELWSLTTDEAESWRTPNQVLRFLRDPEGHLDGPLQRHLDAWDRLCASRRVPAIGGLDAHQPGIRLGARVLSPMPNRRYFRMLRTHVLLDGPPRHELGADRQAVYAALREGRCYLAVDAIAPASGFRFEADGVPMGAETTRQPLELRVEAPREAAIRLLRDGQPLAERRARSLRHRADGPGVYRVEVDLRWRGRARPWILSNPVYVRNPGSPLPQSR